VEHKEHDEPQSARRCVLRAFFVFFVLLMLI